MVDSRAQAPDDGNAAPSIERGREDHLLKKIERHMAGTGKGHHVSLVLDHLHRKEIHVFVATSRSLDLATAFRERGRVTDEEAGGLSLQTALAHEAERIAHRETRPIGRSVQFVVAARDLDRSRRHIDVLDILRTTGRGVDAEGARIGKEIEDAASRCEVSRERAVLALVQEEAGLLSFARIDLEAKTVLLDDRVRLSISLRLRLER